jgi:electron transfer flavoprotein beta subunit
MEVLVCVKRVPMVGGRIVLTADGQDVDTRMAGFTISPHEECAVEEAVQITGRLGGAVSVLTLGSEASIDQLRDCLSVGAGRAILLETDGTEFGPIATADAIAGEVRLQAETGPGYDLVLLGNEAADTGDYQIGVRLAHLLGWPVATGIKAIDIGDSGETGAVVRARRQYRGGDEVFALALPAVVTVKEGINLPRYPSLPGRLRAKRAEIERRPVTWQPEGLRKQGLRVPAAARQESTVLGTGVTAVPALVGVLGELGLLP